MTYDIDHWYGNDISESSTGDLGSVTGVTKGRQRVLRRLLTNPAETSPEGDQLPPDYIWHPDYGAGLGRFIGRAGQQVEAVGRIRSQMLMESCVAQEPAPEISVQFLSDGLAVDVRYTDSETGDTVILSFNIDR